MDNIEYPLNNTLTGDLNIVSDQPNILLSRARLLIDTNVGERLLLPDYGVYVTPFNSSNADFDKTIIDAQIQRYCMDDLNIAIALSIEYELDASLNYNFTIN